MASAVDGGKITVQDFLRQDAMIQDLYFNISEMKLSTLYIISDAPKYDIIWTENSDVIYKSYNIIRDIKVRFVSHCVLD